MANKRRKILSRRGMILAFSMVVVLFFIYIYVLPNVSDAFRRTDIIEYGGIQVKENVTCYLVRDEVAYIAGSAGAVQYYIEEGEQIRNGTKILDIAQGSAVANADRRGMISYYMDGLEQLFNPLTMRDLKKESVEATEINVVNVYGKDAAQGSPLYKIVNSDVWYTIMWIDKESIIKYEKDQSVTLVYEEEQIRGSVEDIIAKGDSFMVILEFNRYWKKMPQLRKIEAEVITSDYKGLTISNESITTVDDKTGVYVKDVSGGYIFRPVKIITSDGKYSLVECGYYYDSAEEGGNRVQTVDIYDEVLRNGKPE